jgi:hypothetical protein
MRADPVDAHVHLYRDAATAARAKGTARLCSGTLPDLLSRLDARGVGRAVVANFLPSAAMRATGRSLDELWARQMRQNAWALERAHGCDRLAVLAGGFAPVTEGAVRQLSQMLRDPCCVGIKLHPSAGHYDADGDDAVALAELAAQAGKALLVHAGTFAPGDPATTAQSLCRLIERAPACRIVVAHLGGAGSAGARDIHTAGPNVWLDTSAVIASLPRTAARELMARTLAEVPASRIIYGSFFPWHSPEEAFDRLLEALPQDVDPQEIMSGSAEDAYRIAARCPGRDVRR